MNFILLATALVMNSSATPAPVVRPPATQPVQVADEIMRRLRRLGHNFDKDRIDRPYDGVGEIC